MQSPTLLIKLTVCLALCSTTLFSQDLKYPQTRKVDQTDNYFGTEVKDPYRWLEDDRSEETADWVGRQNQVTEDYLSKIPFRKKMKDRLTQLWNFQKQTAPKKAGSNYFFYANDGLQNQFVLKMIRGLNEKPVVVLDPNQWPGGGTTHLNDYSVSRDGKYLAYSLSKAGSDWNEIHVINTETLEPLPDKIEWVKFSGISWRGDGFYYSRYKEPDTADVLKGKNQFHKVYFHKLFTPQQNDRLVIEDKEHPLRNFSAGVTSDEKYLVHYAGESSHSTEVYIKDLANPMAGTRVLCPGFEFQNTVTGNDGPWIFVKTNKGAPHYKLIAINAANPSETRSVIPESEEVLQSVGMAKDYFVALYMKDASSRLKVFSREGKFQYEITLPSYGDINELSVDDEENTIFYSYTSYTLPATIFQFDLKEKKQTTFFKPAIDFKDEDYVTTEVFYPSKDGTKIPMFITCKKGTKMDGNNPVLLFGYGGFNVNKTPEFKIERLVFMENGGIFAAPCLRGGGEYGEAWHQAGTKLNKQNVFDDFIAAAEYLIKEKYTNAQKIAIGGRSNGGLLVGACMTQRPDLFKAALPTVGVMDMLRYHKFTIGWAWKGDYGSSEDEVNFRNLYAYSPLHNIKEGQPYPATMVITGDHDDRVVPAHSFKFIATLQEKYKGPNPQLIRIDLDSGHASVTITGSSKPVDKQIAEFSDVFVFTMYQLGMTVR